VNLTADVLSAGAIADQVNAVFKAVVEKNKYYHDKLFRGIALAQGGVPDWLEIPAAEVEAKKQAAIKARTEKMVELDAAVHKALELKPHQF